MPESSRRQLLATAGGVVGLAGLGYVGARTAAADGVVVARYVVGDRRDPTDADSTRILEAERNRDGSVDHRVHPDYRDAVGEPPLTVSPALHRRLTEQFDTVRYHLAHRCQGCSTPQVGRTAFNEAELGDRVRLLYHGASATVVP